MDQKTNDEKHNEDKEGNCEEDNDNDGSLPKVYYLLDGNEARNEGIKNNGDNNKKGETKVKEKNREMNGNENHEDKTMMRLKKQIIMERLVNKMKQIKICWIKLLKTLWIMSLALDFQV